MAIKLITVFRTVVKATLLVPFIIALYAPESAGAFIGRTFSSAEVTRSDAAEFAALIEATAPKYGVPTPLAFAAVRVENASGRREAVRFEPGQMQRGRAAAKKIGVASYELEDQARLYATSHCPLQVMGFNAVKFGKTWLDLHDAGTCVEIGLSELGRCLTESKHKYSSKREAYRGALRCYNAGQVDDMSGQAHALKVEEKLIEQLYAQYAG